MQNGSLMARFAAPTCWNLLHMIHMDGVVDEAGGTTVFTQVRWGAARRSCSVLVLQLEPCSWEDGWKASSLVMVGVHISVCVTRKSCLIVWVLAPAGRHSVFARMQILH